MASGSGWNIWVWLLGVVVRRYIDFLILLIPTPLVPVLFYSSIPTFCSFFKMFFVLVPVLPCNTVEPPLTDSPLCENLSIACYLDGTECIPFVTYTFRALYSGNLRIPYSVQNCITQLRQVIELFTA